MTLNKSAGFDIDDLIKAHDQRRFQQLQRQLTVVVQRQLTVGIPKDASAQQPSQDPGASSLPRHDTLNAQSVTRYGTVSASHVSTPDGLADGPAMGARLVPRLTTMMTVARWAATPGEGEDHLLCSKTLRKYGRGDAGGKKRRKARRKAVSS